MGTPHVKFFMLMFWTHLWQFHGIFWLLHIYIFYGKCQLIDKIREIDLSIWFHEFFLACQKWVQFIFAHHLLLSKAEKQEIWSFFWNAHLCKWVQSSKVTNIISMLLEQFHHHHKCTLHILFLIPSFFNFFFLAKMMDQISNRTHMLRIKEATYAKIRYYIYKSES